MQNSFSFVFEWLQSGDMPLFPLPTKSPLTEIVGYGPTGTHSSSTVTSLLHPEVLCSSMSVRGLLVLFSALEVALDDAADDGGVDGEVLVLVPCNDLLAVEALLVGGRPVGVAAPAPVGWRGRGRGAGGGDCGGAGGTGGVGLDGAGTDAPPLLEDLVVIGPGHLLTEEAPDDEPLAHQRERAPGHVVAGCQAVAGGVAAGQDRVQVGVGADDAGLRPPRLPSVPLQHHYGETVALRILGALALRENSFGREG